MMEIDHHQVERAALIASVPGDELSVATVVAAYPGLVRGLLHGQPARG